MTRNTRLAGFAIRSLVILFLAFPAVAADLSGGWNFVFNTEGGMIEAPVTLTVDGENVTAKMGDTELKGTVREGKLEIAGKHYSPEAGYEAELKLTGKADGNRIAGDGAFDIHTFTFTAEKGD
jgi:hypothetical protein